MPRPSILVSDFDGTISARDFYGLVREHLVPPDAPDHWAAYRAGTLSHFDALNAYFASARPDAGTLERLVDHMDVDPELAPSVAALRAAGWEVVVVSNGSRWYIDRLLCHAGVELVVHSNPGVVESGRLRMLAPSDSPFFDPEVGIRKAAVVRHFLDLGHTVAFCGDGHPDVEPALLVPPGRRFARADLAADLAALGHPFRPFNRWSEVARALLADTTPEPNP
jgi:2,3-diketo-5-methylthio-1-phosphopentane phosphatase